MPQRQSAVYLFFIYFGLFHSREISHAVPDISVHGIVSSVHCSLDLNKYKLVRGLLENNLGEPVEEFLRPYDLQDPRIHVRRCFGLVLEVFF